MLTYLPLFLDMLVTIVCGINFCFPKIGVAIDVIHGHPCVHMVKRGSPVEGLLQPNDKVLSIDDVDTSCMSAADVTHLMVKRMNYQRKITVIRRS